MNATIFKLTLLIFFRLKMATVMGELQVLRKEKKEIEEAKKMAEEQIEAMRKDHEEKVLNYLFTYRCLLQSKREISRSIV